MAPCDVTDLQYEINLIRTAQKMIRRKRATPKDIASILDVELPLAKNIYRHIKKDMIWRFRQGVIWKLHDLTYSQEYYLRYILSSYIYLPLNKILNIVFNRFHRSLKRSLVTSLRKNAKFITPIFDDRAQKLPQDYLISALDYLVDLETYEITDDILFLKNKLFEFNIEQFNGDSDQLCLTLKPTNVHSNSVTMNYDVSVVMGKNNHPYISVNWDKCSISSYVKMFENIRDDYIEKHKSHVTIISEYSSKVQLAYNHVSRSNTEFTFNYIIIPSQYIKEPHPMDDVLNFISLRLEKRGQIYHTNVFEEMRAAVDQYNSDDFEIYYENHLKYYYNLLFNNGF